MRWKYFKPLTYKFFPTFTSFVSRVMSKERRYEINYLLHFASAMFQIRLRQRRGHCAEFWNRQAEWMERFEHLPTSLGCVAAIESRETSSGQIKGKQMKDAEVQNFASWISD